MKGLGPKRLLNGFGYSDVRPVQRIGWGNLYKNDSDAPTAEEIEGYKQYWKEHGFPDVRPSAWQGNFNTTGLEHDDPTYQPIPEQELWAAVIRETIRDARGEGPDAKLSCEDCHIEVDCRCMARVYKPQEIVSYDPSGLRVKVSSYTGSRVHILSSRYVTPRDDGSYIYKRLRDDCPAAHTNQDCAKRFLLSKDFEELCMALTVNVDTARKAAA